MKVDDVENPFGKWSISMKAALVKRGSFMSRGMPRRADGQHDIELTLDGPWTIANSPLTVGQEYTFQCNVDDNNGIEVTGRVETLVPGNDMDDGPTLKVTVQGSDDFDLTLPQLVLA